MTGVMSCRLVVALALFSFSAAQSIAKVKYEWTLPEFDWDNATQKADFESTGRYVPDNCVVSGVKYYKGVTYVTVPRWRLGIPSTLNSVVEVNGSALLRPYPSWEMNKVDDCSALQYVQSMEITPAGVMWILDVGRRNFQATAINKCPPKIILWNMNTDSEIRRTVFPDAVAPYTSSFLNDIVVDLVHNYGYIADAAGEGAIIAYSAESGLARRFVGPSTGVEADARIATINGVNYTIGAAADSIALSPDAETLYYAALAGYTLFGLATEHLRNFDLTNAQLSAQVQSLGRKVSQCGGMATDQHGVLYFGAIAKDAVWKWPLPSPASSQKQVVANDTDMVWIDTFGFGAPGKLLFTTNTLMWFVPPRNPAWGKPPLKIRVWEVDLGNNIQSYLVPQEAMVGSSSDEESSSSSGDAPLTTDEWGGVVIAAFIMGALVAGVVCLVMVRRRKKAQANLELF